jgi:hypothetical protein
MFCVLFWVFPYVLPEVAATRLRVLLTELLARGALPGPENLPSRTAMGKSSHDFDLFVS